MQIIGRARNARSILIAILLAIVLRAWAVSLLPQDFDEPTYIQTAFDYASAFKAGNLTAVIDYPGVREHPAFVKLLYTGDILLLGKAATYTNAFFASRIVSAFFGVIAVACLAFAVGPFAAGLLAIHTMAIKYSSQVYLEAVPFAMSLIAVLAFLRVKKDGAGRWLWISAVALGITAASKYSYLPVILVVLVYLVFFEKKVAWRFLLPYAGLALGTFFFLDVTLWHQPVQRLVESLTFHVQYSQGAHVQEVAYPWYQPLIWILTSAPNAWHPNVFFYPGLDGFITLFAFAGIKREWQQRRWLVVWVVFGLLFLLLWPTKWPQYSLILTPALCVMAAASARQAYQWARAQESYWNYLEGMIIKPSKWVWISLGVFVSFIAVVYLSAAASQAIGRIGWSHITQQNSFLPGNTVYDLLPAPGGKMVIGTDKGAAIWSPPEATDQAAHWTIYNPGNSGLANSYVLSLAQDSLGNLWFGTLAGLSRFDGNTWSSFHANDLGLADEQILALAAGGDGLVFAGTKKGISTWNGASWTPISHLGDETIFTLVCSGNTLWAGTLTGVGREDLTGGQWDFYPTLSPVSHLVVDSTGILWASTTANGLARLDGTVWTYFTTSNSGIPLNSVNSMVELKSGTWWVGMSLSTQVGGVVASLIGQNWRTYLTSNSGSSGAEPLVTANSSANQVWIGTRLQGIDIYQLGR